MSCHAHDMSCPQAAGVLQNLEHFRAAVLVCWKPEVGDITVVPAVVEKRTGHASPRAAQLRDRVVHALEGGHMARVTRQRTRLLVSIVWLGQRAAKLGDKDLVVDAGQSPQEQRLEVIAGRISGQPPGVKVV